MSFPLAGKQKRSKTGCWTCRSKKVKCDEHRPVCHRCGRLNLPCDYLPRKKNVETRFIDESNSVIHRAHKAASQQQSTTNNVALARVINLAHSLPLQLSQKRQTSANSLQLSLAGHEAIRYFRTVFTKGYIIKNPNYSVFAIIFNIAERDPMVMSAVLALGGHSIEHRQQAGMSMPPATQTISRETPLHHYSAALRMMADVLDQREPYDLDALLATLYLMSIYEKTFGVGDMVGLSNHLLGAAHLIEHRLQGKSGPPPLPRRSPLALSAGAKDGGSTALVRYYNDKQREEQPLSLFSARMLVHLAIQDSTASTLGFGGRLIKTLNDLTDSPDTKWPFSKGIISMQNYSRSLHKTMWGDSYPQEELFKDIATKNLYRMATIVHQLRFAISTLTSLTPAEAKAKAATAQDALYQTSDRFAEFFLAADELDPQTNNSTHFVAALRGLVPLYDGVQIELCQATRLLGFWDGDSELMATAVYRILRLAKQTYRHQGVDGLIVISWPLYLAGVESLDVEDQQWVLDVFKQLSEQGKNFERAYKSLARRFATEGDGLTANVGKEGVDEVQLEMEQFVL